MEQSGGRSRFLCWELVGLVCFAGGRAAILKAYYLRNSPTDLNKEVFTVSLNETTNVPYILGRLFSVLEAVQSDATPGINTTIKDRYFNSACATPALVFPTLLKLAQKHLQKLPDGKAVFYTILKDDKF